MAIVNKMYKYNPHRHVKIWLSNKPAVFMNIENKMRLIAMREQNPTDIIHLVYDSSLLNAQAIIELTTFCKEHSISLIDADLFENELTSKNEKTLYQFYKDEITHLSEGGNLALSSDILRLLSPVFTRGAYTDFDVPVDTSELPPIINVNAPILLNIGSLRTRNKDVILSNNDYIAVADSKAAAKDIEKVQKGLINVLGLYDNDFIEKTIEEFGKDSFINRYLIQFMKNRSESIYIARSKSEFDPMSSRELRNHVNQIMNDPVKFLEFKRKDTSETDKDVLLRLRNELNEQLGFFKWLFFESEYNEIKNALTKSDEELVAYLMKKERTLYLKSIVICTTGPIAIAKFLFNGYVFDSEVFDRDVAPYSFNTYGLKNAFKSQNTISMHESVWGMMNFLGSEEGALNDSSWLETGAQLQKSRGELLEERREEFCANLPNALNEIKQDIEDHLKELEDNSKGLWGLFFAARKSEKIKALKEVLTCFKADGFDTTEFKKILKNIEANCEIVYAGWFSRHTQDLVGQLQELSHEAIVFMLTKDRKIDLVDKTSRSAIITQKTLKEQEPYHSPGLSLFQQKDVSNMPEITLGSHIQLVNE